MSSPPQPHSLHISGLPFVVDQFHRCDIQFSSRRQLDISRSALRAFHESAIRRRLFSTCVTPHTRRHRLNHQFGAIRRRSIGHQRKDPLQGFRFNTREHTDRDHDLACARCVFFYDNCFDLFDECHSYGKLMHLELKRYHDSRHKAIRVRFVFSAGRGITF